MQYLTKCCSVPSTSFGLFSYRVWGCYVQPLWRRCIYKKIHYSTFILDPRSHKMLLRYLYNTWPIHLQGFKLLRPTVTEVMLLQENTLFDLWPWPWGRGQWHTNCCSVASTSCGIFICKLWGCYVQPLRRRCIYKKIHQTTFDLDLGHTKCCSVPYTSCGISTCKVPARFEFATSNR